MVQVLHIKMQIFLYLCYQVGTFSKDDLSEEEDKIRKGTDNSKFALLNQTQLKQGINQLDSLLPLKQHNNSKSQFSISVQ